MAPRSWSGRSGQEVAQDGSVGTGGGGAVDGLVRTVGSSGRRGWSVLIRCNIDIHYIYITL
jgi:hypothetical protein